MKLTSVEVESFRSINSLVSLKLDPKMTVIVGANDHGKSNLLKSLKYLNDGSSPTIEDLYSGKDAISAETDSSPDISFIFTLDEKESADLKRRLLQSELTKTESWTDEMEKAVKLEIKSDPQIIYKLQSSKLCIYRRLGTGSQPSGHIFDRSLPPGVDKFCTAIIRQMALASRPRVIFFEDAPSLPHTISVEEAQSTNDSVIKGLLRLGGHLGKASKLIRDDNSGRKARNEFNRRFNREFGKRYSQYKKVEWTLDLTTTATELILEVSDHAVDLGNPHERSLGFRSWLAFLLALYGETGESNPSGCLIVIDEPDVHLHPRAQKDMLRYLEELSNNNMVVFATHSPFMVPRKFPQRVRQVKRESKGSILIENPYRESWVSVVADLGIAGADMFRFADKVIVVEGLADTLLITALLALNEGLGNKGPNLDDIAFRWHDGASYVPHVVRAMDDGAVRILALVDDDEPGKKAAKKVNDLRRSRIGAKTLSEMGFFAGSLVEDTVPVSVVADAMSLLLERMTDPWNLSKDQIDKVLLKIKDVSGDFPRRPILAKVLVDSGCLEHARDFPSRQFANCAATKLATGTYPLTKDEETQLKRFCGELLKLLP